MTIIDLSNISWFQRKAAWWSVSIAARCGVPSYSHITEDYERFPPGSYPFENAQRYYAIARDALGIKEADYFYDDTDYAAQPKRRATWGDAGPIPGHHCGDEFEPESGPAQERDSLPDRRDYASVLNP